MTKEKTTAPAFNFDFDLDFSEREYKVKLKGVQKLIVLKELSGKERENYFAQMGTIVDLKSVDTSAGENQKVQVKKLDGMSTMLLERCAWWRFSEDEKDDNGNHREDERVTKEQLLSWPSRVLTALTKDAQDMNGLKRTSKADAEKNSETEN